MTDRPVRLLSYADIAVWFGVDPSTVRSWRFPRSPAQEAHPFPDPDVEVGMDESQRPVPGWRVEREREIRLWHAARPGQGVGGGRPKGASPRPFS